MLYVYPTVPPSPLLLHHTAVFSVRQGASATVLPFLYLLFQVLLSRPSKDTITRLIEHDIITLAGFIQLQRTLATTNTTRNFSDNHL